MYITKMDYKERQTKIWKFLVQWLLKSKTIHS